MYVEECYDVTAILERIESKTIKKKNNIVRSVATT